MKIKQVKYLTFNQQNAPEVLKVTNELAISTDRAPHDAVKRLVLEAGSARIAQPGLYKEFIDKVNALKEPNTQPAKAG